MPGRAAAPATLRLINGRSEGRDSGGRKVEPPPPFRRTTPSAPSWLSREAKAEWKRVVPELTRLDLLKESDRAALTVYCETWATYVDAIKLVRSEGPTVVSESGAIKRNPAVSAANEAASLLRSYAQEFGLTPSAESKLSGLSADAVDESDDPFE